MRADRCLIAWSDLTLGRGKGAALSVWHNVHGGRGRKRMLQRQNRSNLSSPCLEPSLRGYGSVASSFACRAAPVRVQVHATHRWHLDVYAVLHGSQRCMLDTGSV
jgi:hypothetical protein